MSKRFNPLMPSSLSKFMIANLKYRNILQGITETFASGQMIGVVGPNGAGKSTLLKLLAGVAKPDQGEIQLDGSRIQTIPAKERARKLAYLPQQVPDDVLYTVREYVTMGRYAHQTGLFDFKRERQQERNIVEQALVRFDLLALENEVMGNISGGERQRAAIARCFAQGSNILLLDEPISNLDLFYQMEILQELKKLADEGCLVILAIHHLELAARYCSRLLMLHRGTIYSAGPPQDVLTPDGVKEVFRMDVKIFNDPYQDALRLSIF